MRDPVRARQFESGWLATEAIEGGPHGAHDEVRLVACESLALAGDVDLQAGVDHPGDHVVVP